MDYCSNFIHDYFIAMQVQTSLINWMHYKNNHSICLPKFSIFMNVSLGCMISRPCLEGLIFDLTLSSTHCRPAAVMMATRLVHRPRNTHRCSPNSHGNVTVRMSGICVVALSETNHEYTTSKHHTNNNVPKHNC